MSNHGFGVLIKKRLVDLGFGVMELVDQSEVSYSVVNKIMRGDNSVRVSDLIRVLGCVGLKLEVNND